MTELKPIKEVLPGANGQESLETITLEERDALILDLVEMGISLRKAEHLVNKYSHRRIRRQLAWLPHRGARRPASLLIASIERDFDAPAYVD